ncbi:TonB-dependent receptor [Gillisia sp. M10.2A]|uniref:TonB-dependent receptor n=1 Tax=Gillisia lutea TaxID=2909668 RepID=A0ABS9EEZ5_9FLAO|nr:TonB-dependent receptor [Gillisia lutea]MCF4100734.1 TonB-dependent receptor [Gillisia lutea]
MRILFSALFTVFVIAISSAQEIIVIDKDSNLPISNVMILNKSRSKTVVTNSQGKADVSKFETEELLVFTHVSHLTYTISKARIISNKSIVYLTEDQNNLQEVVLSVAKFEQDLTLVPQKIISLEASEIQFSNPQTAADLLENSGKVFVQKSQLGGGSPMIRGFATNRLLITVDGVRMNTAIFRSGNLQNVISIDPLIVDKTEVLLGPGSVVYGSDAVGGVMNFYTLQPKFSREENALVLANAYTRYSSANEEGMAHANFNIGFEKWAFLSAVTYSDFGNLKMGSHGPKEYLRYEYASQENGEDITIQNPDPKVQKPTGYEQINLLQKVKFKANEDWDFNLGLLYSTTSNYPRYDRLYRKKNGELRAAEWYYGPQSWFLGNLKINKKGNSQLYDKAQFTAAYQYFEESRHDRDFGKELRYNTQEQVDAYSINLDFEKSIDENSLFYGAEYVLNNVHSSGNTYNITTEEKQETASRYPDASSWQSMAAYATYLWKIQANLSLQSGVRYSHILLNANFIDEFYDFPFQKADINTGALTGSIGINWQQNQFFNWRLNLSTAFRAPNIDDVGKIFDSEPGAVVVPNPDLKPEYAYNSEMGLKWTPSEKIKLELAGFYTLLDNAMVRRDFNLNGLTQVDYQGEPSRVQAIQNAANAYVYGFEAGAELDIIKSLQLKSYITYTQGKEEQDDGAKKPLRHAAPIFGNTHLVWTKNRLKLDLFGEYNGQFDFDELAPSEQSKDYLYATDRNGNPYSPSWYTLNVTGQYEFDINWTATASLENITDQRYRTYSSGISAAGRNLILALKYSL